MTQQEQDAIRKQYDEYIEDSDWLTDAKLPVAIVLNEKLKPVEAMDSSEPSIIFPPTYAPQRRGDPPKYNIDVLRDDISPEQATRDGKEATLCRIDSVGSQANRMEVCFMNSPLDGLVPQSTLELKNQSKNLLEAGHRIADAAVRLSQVKDSAGSSIDLTEKINALMKQGNAKPLAKLAPTSLLFGFWDSRETGFKFGRILSSTIDATNAKELTRSSQYSPTLDPSDVDLKGIDPAALQSEQGAEEEIAATAQKDRKLLANVGLHSVPSTKTHGGVRVYGQIVRRTTISLVGLRALAVTQKVQTTVEPKTAVNRNAQLKIDDETRRLRRYVLGLALVAGRSQTQYDLRQGCLLVNAEEPTAVLIYADGERKPFVWKRDASFRYAKLAADDFGVGQSFTAEFDNKKAQGAIEREKKKGKAKSK